MGEPQIQERTDYSIEEYLALEDKATEKSEYLNGTIRAMSGGSGPHSLISSSCIGAFLVALKGKGCSVFNSDMKIWVAQTKAYLYPDVAVLCGEAQYQKGRSDILLNPTLVIEVLSPGTANYDFVEKFDRYTRIPSLKEYVLVSQDRYRVEVRSAKDEWGRLHVYDSPADSILFESIPAAIPLGDFYAQVNFSSEG